jgi:hypothetical protein
MPRMWSLPILLIPLVHCGGIDAERGDPVVRDSAGVEIVDNPGHDWAALER